MNRARETTRVLAIGLDAAEPELIERWLSEGSLPHLAGLRARGVQGRLTSSARWLAGSPWPTFYTGTTPAEHGFYHCLQWRGQRMGLMRPGTKDLNPRPFWRDLGSAGRRVVALDIPMALPPAPFDGLEITGWATHDQLAPPVSHPPGLLAELRRRVDDAPMSEEFFAPQTLAELTALRDALIETSQRTAQAAEWLLRHVPWDLFLVGFSALHRGGHRLWDHTGVNDLDESLARQVCQEALRDLYVNCDTAVGRLLDAVDRSAYQLVFSLHGMGPNTCRVDLLPELLDRILGRRQPPRTDSPRPSWRARVTGMVPHQLRDMIKKRLPQSMRDRITTHYRMGSTDWKRTRAFSLVADLQGYVRINLKGREAEGIVSPGAEYDALCRQIVEGLSSFVDADTGEGIVECVVRSDQVFEPGQRSENLPDLIVQWAPGAAAQHRAVVSTNFGEVPWPTPHRMPDGRSGNHRPEGFLLAAGPGILPGTVAKADILDLAPTIYHWLGLNPPAHMRQPLAAIAGTGRSCP